MKGDVWFSKNGIKITKEYATVHGDINHYKTFVSTQIIDDLNVLDSEFVEVRKESPLGFWYTQKIQKSNIHKKLKCVTYRTYELVADKYKYTLSYPYMFVDKITSQTIGIESRPWDIDPRYGAFPDRMMKVLYNEVNKFMDILYSVCKEKNKAERIRKDILIDLFGYEDGYKELPNNIKILSHGFDLKTSFRKRKES